MTETHASKLAGGFPAHKDIFEQAFFCRSYVQLVSRLVETADSTLFTNLIRHARTQSKLDVSVVVRCGKA
jgi:hypothetical protein